MLELTQMRRPVDLQELKNGLMGHRKRRTVRNGNQAQYLATSALSTSSSQLERSALANPSPAAFEQGQVTIDPQKLHNGQWGQVIEAATIGIGLITAESGSFTLANPALCCALGRSASELQACSWRDLFTELRVQQDGAAPRQLTSVLRPDQSQAWLRCSLTPLPESEGRSGLLLLQVEDITEQHQAAALAEQEHELLNTLLEHIDAAIYIKDRQGRYLYANPATLVSLGIESGDADSIRGCTDFDLLPIDVAEKLSKFDRQVLEEGGPLRREERLPRPDATEGIYLSEKLVCGQQEGGAGFLLGFSSDITELRPATERLETSERQFRLLAENSGEVIVQLSPDGTICWVSPSLTPTLGWQSQEWIGRSGSDFLLHRGETAQYKHNLERLQQGQSLVIARDQVLARDGSVHWVETAASPFINAAGEVDGSVARLRLVDDQVEAETKLRHSEERYRLLAENARDVIWSITADGEISYVSPSVQWLRGINPEEAMVQTLEQIHPAESRQRVESYLRQVARDCRHGQKPEPFRGELEYLCADGAATIWCDVLALPVVNNDGSLRYLLGTSRDITERKHYEQALDLTNQQLNTLASTDSLTGVWNRHHLQLMLQQQISSSSISSEPLAMILCDIDHFKQVNDRHGHSVGDQVLVEFCRRVQCCLRGSDQLGRWGGEEFLILVPQGTAAGAAVLAEKLRAALAEQPIEPVGRVTASFGVAQRKPNELFGAWFQRLDNLLYAAKAAGRDLVMVEQD
jgi:diguanylate cyclase (GGDEF)-like protein/PAS domain S-box-containing protein